MIGIDSHEGTGNEPGWRAWSPENPGMAAWAPSRERAMQRFVPKYREYRAWLAVHERLADPDYS